MQMIQREDEALELPDKLPLIPLKDVVVFPWMIVPIIIDDEISMRALQEATLLDQYVFLSIQKRETQRPLQPKDLYSYGVVARVLQTLKLPEGPVKVLIEGLVRAKIVRFLKHPEFMRVRIQTLPRAVRVTKELQAKIRTVFGHFTDYVKLHRQIPDEVLMTIHNIEGPDRLADMMAMYIVQKSEVRQKILATSSIDKQLDLMIKILMSEKELLELERKIDGEVRSRLQKTQREYYLHEQMRAIREELGEEDSADEVQELQEKIRAASMPEEVEEKAFLELNRLKKMHMMSPEFAVVRNYLDWLTAMPWNVRSEDNLDIAIAQRILDEDHYGLERPKQRIVEYLSVISLAKRIKGPILCLVGPPGTGKTSLGKSVARALGRKLVRVSLGGVRDEAEIRGHRRTYIGAMPGRIIQSIRRAGTKNPVFLLDEVDKMSVDFRGDPSAALLEVLDPEQNHTFNDHYLEVDFDLSEVMFITTANVSYAIPNPLKDRMEIIELPGYLDHEKWRIARGFLVPKQRQEHGIQEGQLRITDAALMKIINNYTQEAGVRNLQREIASICRKVARSIVENKTDGMVTVNARNLKQYLGVEKLLDKKISDEDKVGVCTGLAWTPSGGDILNIEVNLMRGKGQLLLTGKLGEVMKESAEAAMSYARANASALGIEENFYRKLDVHIHVPEGAIPKDGPSAGIAMAAGLISALTNRPIYRDIAMTGEITIRGSVLPIGGLNEKALAAQRAGIRKVVIPRKNSGNLEELPAEIKRGLTFTQVDTMDEVLKVALYPK